MARRVVIVDGVRTAFGRAGGGLRDFASCQLAGYAIRGLLEKTDILSRAKVDSVFAGSASHDSISCDPARYAALHAGLPYETSASFVEMQCGSAIDCINHAAWKILSGCADVVIAGGMESHSQLTAKFSMAVEPYKRIPPMPMKNWLTPVEEDNINMVQVSDGMAVRWNISREETDAYALRSQQRAKAAVDKGYFKEEIIPVAVPTRKGPDIIIDTDEHLRPDTTMETLAKLRPVYPDGVTTAGNSSGFNDGAGFVLMMTEELAEKLGYQPYAAWIAGADYGVDPKYMGIGPAYSNMLALKRAGITFDDLSVVECNEAFAAQNLGVIKEMENMIGHKINQDIWNPNGGAISFGHPNGASGARIAMFCMRELERNGGKYGLFGACCGGGHGVTTVLENLRR